MKRAINLKTESHLKLSIHLAKKYLSYAPLKTRVAFVLGSIGPDFNLFSYLKGFKVHAFHGHNWENSRNFIKHKTNSILKSNFKSTINYYSLGRLLHFITDAFTYPHNRMYKGGLRQHTDYEKQLHNILMIALNNNPDQKTWLLNNNFDIITAHANYSIQNMTLENDVNWILAINEQFTQRFSTLNSSVKTKAGFITEYNI